MDGDVCRECSKQVFDLDAMSDSASRRQFADASGEVCVKYLAPARAALTAVAIVATGLTGTQAIASDSTSSTDIGTAVDENSEIIVGGVRRLSFEERRQLRREAYWAERREAREKKRATKAKTKS